MLKISYIFNVDHSFGCGHHVELGSIFICDTCNTGHFYMVTAPKSRMSVNSESESVIMHSVQNVSDFE